MKLILATLMLFTATNVVSGQSVEQTKGTFQDKFRQLEEVLPTANIYRAGSGAPGHAYWQQQADYNIKASLNDETRTITGSETITYKNNSPDTLKYLWLQLDQNLYTGESDGFLSRQNEYADKITLQSLHAVDKLASSKHGHKITRVADKSGKALPYTINKTMMRIDLPKPLKSGGSFSFQVDWNFSTLEAKALNSRGGYEYFKKDDNNLYVISQWFPRMAAYTDSKGWDHKQFLGNGEFTLEFGNYDIELTVPSDHIVSATGELQNAKAVLTTEQMSRFEKAKTAAKPVFIVTPAEALANETSRSKDTKTWNYKATNVRDFAWASSRKFIWDAMGYHQKSDDRVIMAMSFYPKEGEPLWSKYSTEAVIHTLETYSKYTFPYPYPVAQSVNGPVGGMEYPMLSFNGPRNTVDEEGNITYSRGSKYFLIGVVIHEVGHNYFPMIVNSDERQWTWMDEGLNSFVQFLAQEEWEENYPQGRGEPRDIGGYMTSENQVPIMTQSDSILQFGPNGYFKPATALNILRETVMGRELFDYSFREYAQRWMFKRPYPADFFRTMEDASGVDLDWFWRGWFYSTDHVDVSLEKVTWATIAGDADAEATWNRKQRDAMPTSMTRQRNATLEKRTDRRPELLDTYNEFDKYTVVDSDREAFDKKMAEQELDDEDRAKLNSGANFYFVDFENKGGLVSPIIITVEYSDGTKEDHRYPAEIWRKNQLKATKMLVTEKEIKSITLDPYLETGDADLNNNNWPAKPVRSRLELYKFKQTNDKTLQQKFLDQEAARAAVTAAKEAEKVGETSSETETE
jgi:hypothetical protein